MGLCFHGAMLELWAHNLQLENRNARNYILFHIIEEMDKDLIHQGPMPRHDCFDQHQEFWAGAKAWIDNEEATAPASENDYIRPGKTLIDTIYGYMQEIKPFRDRINDAPLARNIFAMPRIDAIEALNANVQLFKELYAVVTPEWVREIIAQGRDENRTSYYYLVAGCTDENQHEPISATVRLELAERLLTQASANPSAALNQLLSHQLEPTSIKIPFSNDDYEN